jgi:uncharacterized protein (TIGR02145 family)
MKNCINCGHSLEMNAKFCLECGSKQPELTSTQENIYSTEEICLDKVTENNNTNDGSVIYEEIKIGNQIWMTKNLNLDKFRNGDSIPQAKTAEEWIKVGKNGEPAWCYYDNDPANGDRYGKLYNFYAVNDPRGLAPEGWKIPSDEDWTRLTDFLGGESVAGKKMKSTEFWEDNDEGESGNGTDESGFSGFPGGARFFDGSYSNYGYTGYWWSATEFQEQSDTALLLILGYTRDFNLEIEALDKANGFFVRCVKASGDKKENTPSKIFPGIDLEPGITVKRKETNRNIEYFDSYSLLDSFSLYTIDRVNLKKKGVTLKEFPQANKSDKIKWFDLNVFERTEKTIHIFPTRMTWVAAVNACQALGLGWQLPTIEEVENLKNQMDQIKSDNWNKADVWSSTEYTATYAWYYSKENCVISNFDGNKENKKFVIAIKK